MPGIQESVYRRILRDRSNGRWKGGERLSETKLAAELGVSRIPVREALLKLSAEGLLERQPGFGCRVPHRDFEKLTEGRCYGPSPHRRGIGSFFRNGEAMPGWCHRC